MDPQEVGCGYMDWIGLAQDRDRWRTLVCVVMNLQVPWNAGNFLTSCKPVSFSRRTLHHAVSKYRWDCGILSPGIFSSSKIQHVTCNKELLICYDNKHAENSDNLNVVNKKGLMQNSYIWLKPPIKILKNSNFAVIMFPCYSHKRLWNQILSIMCKLTENVWTLHPSYYLWCHFQILSTGRQPRQETKGIILQYIYSLMVCSQVVNLFFINWWPKVCTNKFHGV